MGPCKRSSLLVRFFLFPFVYSVRLTDEDRKERGIDVKLNSCHPRFSPRQPAKFKTPVLFFLSSFWLGVRCGRIKAADRAPPASERRRPRGAAGFSSGAYTVLVFLFYSLGVW